MSRASVIVSREPPDPDMDPRVKDILMEEDVEDEIASTYSKNYETSEKFAYFDEELNVIDNDNDNDDDTDKSEDDDGDIDNDTDKSVGDDDNDNDINDTINVTKKSYMTKKEKLLEKQSIKETKISIVHAAVESMKNEEFPSIRACAQHYNIAHSTLSKYMKSGEEYTGSGRKNEVLFPDEEEKIVNCVKKMLLLGYGFDARRLADLIQELLLAVVKVNPDRNVEKFLNNRPDSNFVYNFARRHGLVYRKTMELCNARAAVSKEEIDLWFQDTREALVDNPEFSECFKDPRRLLNLDETALNCGTGKGRVFAPIGYKAAPQKKSLNSKENVTGSFTVTAAGDLADVTVVYGTQRNFARKKLEKLPKDGISGEWHAEHSENGWMDRDVFLQILKNLDKWLTDNDVARPVILFVDGHKSHYSLEICDFADEAGIKLWLLKPNSTQTLQPLDKVHYQILKKEISARVSAWLAQNPGGNLDKYQKIIEIVYPAVEKVFGKRKYSVKSFEITGLYPFNPNAIKAEQTAPATMFAKPSSTVTSGALALESTPGSSSAVPDPDPSPAPIADELLSASEEALISLDDPLTLPPSNSASTPDPALNHPGTSASVPSDVPSSSSSSVSSESSSSEPTLTTCPPRSLEQKRETLLQYELNHLNGEQRAEFQQFFCKKIYKVREPLYMAWLHLKVAAEGTEEEIFDHILDSTVPKGIQKRKTKRQIPLSGPDRYAPQSEPFREVLKEQLERANKIPKLSARGRGRGGGRGRGRGGSRGGGRGGGSGNGGGEAGVAS